MTEELEFTPPTEDKETYVFFVGVKNGQVFNFKKELEYMSYDPPLIKVNNKTFTDYSGKTFSDERINYEWCYVI